MAKETKSRAYLVRMSPTMEDAIIAAIGGSDQDVTEWIREAILMRLKARASRADYVDDAHLLAFLRSMERAVRSSRAKAAAGRKPRGDK